MKVIIWFCWCLVSCTYLTEARYKMRRPMPPSPPIFKKLPPIGHRISVGNTMHITGNFLHKRMSYKPPLNHRIRRPPAMLGVLPNTWKKPVPMMNPVKLLNNQASLPQRPPVKEFHVANKVPEYNTEYRSESVILPPMHRRVIDDDRSPIHTIPAPNLSIVDKPYPVDSKIENKSVEPALQQQYLNDVNYNIEPKGPLAHDFGTLTTTTNILPIVQNTITDNSFPIKNHYEVTESSDITQNIEYQTILPGYITPAPNAGTLPEVSILNPELQVNEAFLNHPVSSSTGLIGTNIQFGQTNTPMQTNLHSSLHVGFPDTAAQAQYTPNPAVPNRNVGQPGLANQPLTVAQFYELLNSLPQHLTRQYIAVQQPQVQQHLLSQVFDPAATASFSQPQMQSFNYDEQTNSEQQMHDQPQIFNNQEYEAEKNVDDYIAGIDSSGIPESNLQQSNKMASVSDTVELPENHLEYEKIGHEKDHTTYFNKLTSGSGISTQFYSTLPNREAAEKLAALAAAGNINSQLISQLKKQQDLQQDSFPTNHKNDFHADEQQAEETSNYDRNSYEQQQQQQQQQQQRYVQEDEAQYDQEQNEQEYIEKHHLVEQGHEQRHHEKPGKDSGYGEKYVGNHRSQQQQTRNRQEDQNKRPLRIMILDDEEMENDDESEQSNARDQDDDVEYEYKDEEPADINANYKQPSNTEFGSRLRSAAQK